MVSVKIGRCVNLEDLRNALITAAKQTEFRVRVDDIFHETYNLPSGQKTRNLRGKTVSFYERGRDSGVMPDMLAYIKDEQDSFILDNCRDVSADKVHKYLKALAENLT